MRISGDPADPDFVPPDQCRGVVVFFNGTPIKDCITVDEEAGTALRYKTRPNGNIMVDYARGEVVTEELRGRFSVFIPRARPADGFDAWMRERTEWAHAEFMARTASLNI